MAGSVNKEAIAKAYQKGMSLPQIQDRFGVPMSTARYHLVKAGILRSRKEGIQIAARSGRLGSGWRGKTRTLSDEHRMNIAKARIAWGDQHAKGVSIKPNGYVEYTRGPHKGRSVHVIMMEARLGRRLLEDEHVHHIDGDKQNNSMSNLALVTKAGHMRLHQRERKIRAKQKES